MSERALTIRKTSLGYSKITQQSRSAGARNEWLSPGYDIYIYMIYIEEFPRNPFHVFINVWDVHDYSRWVFINLNIAIYILAIYVDRIAVLII